MGEQSSVKAVGMSSSLTSSLIIKKSVVHRVGIRWETYSVNHDFFQGGSLLWSAAVVLVGEAAHPGGQVEAGLAGQPGRQ